MFRTRGSLIKPWAHRFMSLNQTLKGDNYWEGWLLVHIKVVSPLWKRLERVPLKL